MAGPTPGLTRDAVTVELPPLPDGRLVRLVDTAGMRRWGSWDLTTPLEGAAVGLAKKALERAHVVALVVDGSAGAPAGLTHDRPVFQRPTPGGAAAAAAPTNRRQGRAADADAASVTGWGLTRQDLAIAEQVLDEGRGLVVVLNKTDAVADKAAVVAAVRRQLDGMHQGAGVEVVATSALRGGGVGGLLPAVLRTYDAWNVRVPTGKLNAWLRLTARHHPPPSVTLPGRTRPGRDGAPTTSTRSVHLRMKYLTQTTARPPTFALFANRATRECCVQVTVPVWESVAAPLPLSVIVCLTHLNSPTPRPLPFSLLLLLAVPENYSRFLVNALRREFGLGGVPLRLVVRSAANPYTAAGRAQGAVAATARKREEGSRRRAAATASAPSTRSLSATTSLEVAGGSGGGGSAAGIQVLRTTAAAAPSRRRGPQRTGTRA
jgi:GTPase